MWRSHHIRKKQLSFVKKQLHVLLQATSKDDLHTTNRNLGDPRIRMAMLLVSCIKLKLIRFSVSQHLRYTASHTNRDHYSDMLQ